MLAIGALLLAGCAGVAKRSGGGEAEADAEVDAATRIELGNNAIGEPCRLVLATAGDGAAARTVRYDLFCGAWEEPSGVLYATRLAEPVPADPAAAEAVITREQSLTAWARDLGERVQCRPAGWTDGPGGGRLMTSACNLRSGGWPYMMVATGIDRTLYHGDGIPSMADVILTGIARLTAGPDAAATAATAADTRFDAIRRLQAELGAEATAFGRGDLGDFERLVELGRLSNSVEDYKGAEAAYRRALDIQTRSLGENSPALGETLMSLALEVSNQGRSAEAVTLFGRAEPLVQKSFDKAAQARLASYRAFDATNSGDHARALTLAREANRVRRSIVTDLEPPEGAPASPSALGNLTIAWGELLHGLMAEATTALRAKETGAAVAAADEAWRIYARTRGLPGWWQARIKTIQGRVAEARGDIGPAIVLLKQAVQTNYLLFGDSWPVASALLELGGMQADNDLDADAVASFRDAFTFIANDPNPPSLLPFDRLAGFLKAADTLARQDPAQRDALAAEMFRAVQFGRDGVVGQTITRASARFATADPQVAELVRRQQDTVRERDRLRLQLADETAKADKDRNRAEEERLAKLLTEISERSRQLERELQAAFPNYAQLTRFQPIEPATLQGLLQADEGLLLYRFGADRSFGFLVTPGGLTVFPIALTRKGLAERVAELREAFAPKDGRLLRFDEEAGFDLHEKLMGPVADRLAEVRRLVIVPDGALSSLPPAVLVREKPVAGQPVAWLMRRFAIAVAPSIQAFVSLRRLEAPVDTPRPMLAFADPPFTGKAAPGSPGASASLDALGEECRVGAPMNPELLRNLSRLAETADEVRRVSQVLGGRPEDIVLGAEVTKAAVRARELDRYRVIYFATHGLLPGELRCQSEPGLALAPPPAPPASPADDGLLTSSDIALLNIRAELVVLSACNTAAGAGGRFGGEALTGLAEAFFFAGARGMLVTHWQVPSEPTVQLMTGLFDRQGRDPTLALTEALSLSQIALADRPETAHPFFWGPSPW